MGIIKRLAWGVFFTILVLILGVAVGGWLRGYSFREFVFKNERKVELRAKGWDAPRVYSMTGFSDGSGIKAEI